MKNSWILSQSEKEKYIHNYFCACTNEFRIKTTVDEVEAPDVLCPKCGNDYFIDAKEWERGSSTKIWKQFYWEREESVNKGTWRVELYFKIPRYSEKDSSIIFDREKLLGATLSQETESKIEFEHAYPVMAKYSLYTDGKVQELKKLLMQDAKEYLFQNLIDNRPFEIEWIKESDLNELSIDDKFKCLNYFLTHKHLKEMNMFHWKMPILQRNTIEYPSQEKMLDYIVGHKTEKSVRKALYKTYMDALEVTGYHPYSDYVFSRVIEDQNFLVELLSIYPAVKQHIFTDETFTYAIEFIEFLKTYYSEKQISKLFISEMQNEKTKRSAALNWRDTLRLIQAPDSFEYLEQFFQKVKLNTKSLHDEVIRVSHLAAFDRGDHSTLAYKPHQNSVEVIVEDLEFRLPKDTVELSEWAKELHNCMFGYANTIKSGRSIIYGVFREYELLYAVELRAMKIAQALGKFNRKIDELDINIIKKWHNDFYIKSITAKGKI